MIKVALMGHGVVGSGVMEVFRKNFDSIRRKVSDDIEVKYILDRKEFSDLPYSGLFVKDFDTILNDDEVSVVIEVMGGLEPAFTFVKACLEKGKSVVSSNKELVAQKGAVLLKTAREHNVNFFFEASVGGGIPIIRPLHQCLAANEINEIAGILNGTTNFILTKMIREQMGFKEALELAQSLGYAERNPSADVQGLDACRKICILASIAFSKHVYPENVVTEGIEGVTLKDVEYAEDWGGVIKLIGRAKKLSSGKLAVKVSPAFLSNDSQLAGVDDVFNGILVRADATGDVVFYGKGAGKLPTASAVVADVIDAAREHESCKTLYWTDTGENVVEDDENVYEKRYFCLTGASYGDVEKLGVGIDKKLLRRGALDSEIAFVTEAMSSSQVNSFKKGLKACGADVMSCISVLDY